MEEMERDASLATKKLRHDRRRARQRAKKRGELVMPFYDENGKPDILRIKGGGVGTRKDITAYVASLNRITEGGYVRLGGGFPIIPPERLRVYRVHKDKEVDCMNRVKEVREARGLTQTELARRTHIHPSNLSAVERGRLLVWPKAKRALARVLKCNQAELFPSKGEERVG